ncbi:Amino-acid permease GAP3 [Pseudocercospora fuligena]|uniref:Amino-acid permease GAP3 n=1 Tax=Pseudocercospora fuligena TaxID=685502 RepID=A0A8H6REA6_9PEZI|nr:Amino-acid permease GAP3 [Pseudocercospora fuligena]
MSGSRKSFDSPVVQQVISQQDGEVKETTLGDIETKGGEYRRSFTARHIHIISLGGQIGAGLFISSGKNLRDGGPATLFLAFATVCTCVFAVLNTVSEMTIAFPTSGNYIDYADRFVDPALAFAGGFSMWLGWTAIVAAEATFFSVIINYWAENRVNDAVWYTVFLVIMLVIFALPNTVFAWFEYATSIMKVLALFVFILAGFAMVLGAGPNGYVHHGETWSNGLAFRNGFKGYSNSVLLAVLAIGDNTFTGFLAGEAKTPRFSIAHAVILIPIRVTVLYLLSMLFIGLLVPATDQRLLGGSGIAASPFVIALDEAGIPGLPELLNVVIMFAVAAIGAESVFVASRILRAMSHQRLIPSWVAHVDRQGRPRWALLITYTSAVALTYCNLSAGGITVFNWLAQIATTGYFMVWVVIGITSFRFRAALKAQDDSLFRQNYAWQCKWWPVPPAWLLLCCSLYTGCSFYLALYPIGSDSPSAYSFFQYMIGTVLILGLGTIYKVVFRTKLRDPKKVDLRTGRRSLSEEEIKMLDDYYRSSKWRRLASFLQLW